MTIDIRKANPIERVLDRLGSIELLGVVFSPAVGEGTILYRSRHGELVCHLFGPEGHTFSGAYEDGGDDPRLSFETRAASTLRREGLLLGT